MTFAYVVIGLVLLIYLGAPLIIKFEQTIAMTPTNRPYDPSTLPPEAGAFFYNSIKALQTYGFIVVDYITRESVPNVTPCVVYMVNRSTGDMATIACFYTNMAGQIRLSKSSIFCHREFTNGTQVSIAHVPKTTPASTYKYRPYVNGFLYTEITDAGELYRIFSFAAQKYAGSRTPVIPAAGREIEAFAAADHDVQNYQVKAGILKVDEARSVYVPTWYGAYYMTWLLFWPFRQIRSFSSRQKAARLLNECRRAANR